MALPRHVSADRTGVPNTENQYGAAAPFRSHRKRRLIGGVREVSRSGLAPLAAALDAGEQPNLVGTVRLRHRFGRGPVAVAVVRRTGLPCRLGGAPGRVGRGGFPVVPPDMCEAAERSIRSGTNQISVPTSERGPRAVVGLTPVPGTLRVPVRGRELRSREGRKRQDSLLEKRWGRGVNTAVGYMC